MSAAATTVRPPPLDRSTIVARHQSCRGLKVEQNLLNTYTVELDPFGLFIADSRHEAFNMAVEALCNTRPQAKNG